MFPLVDHFLKWGNSSTNALPVFNGDYLPASQIPAAVGLFFHQVSSTVQFCSSSVPPAFTSTTYTTEYVMLIPPEQKFPTGTLTQLTPILNFPLQSK